MPQPDTHLTLNDLLAKARLDPERVLVFRHRPPEPDLRKRLQWLAAEPAGHLQRLPDDPEPDAGAGDGGNVLLRQRDPAHFTFAILQRVSPDMEPAEVIQLEASWKARLHTPAPYGLNDD